MGFVPWHVAFVQLALESGMQLGLGVSLQWPDATRCATPILCVCSYIRSPPVVQPRPPNK